MSTIAVVHAVLVEGFVAVVIGASDVPALANIWKVNEVVSNVIGLSVVRHWLDADYRQSYYIGLSVVSIQPVSAFAVPSVTYTTIPATISDLSSKSVALVNT